MFVFIYPLSARAARPFAPIHLLLSLIQCINLSRARAHHAPHLQHCFAPAPRRLGARDSGITTWRVCARRHSLGEGAAAAGAAARRAPERRCTNTEALLSNTLACATTHHPSPVCPSPLIILFPHTTTINIPAPSCLPVVFIARAAALRLENLLALIRSQRPSFVNMAMFKCDGDGGGGGGGGLLLILRVLRV